MMMYSNSKNVKKAIERTNSFKSEVLNENKKDIKYVV